MINKRGSISIWVMVLGTLVIFPALMIALLFNSSTVIGNFDVVYSYGSVYAEQAGLENSMYFILVESFLNSYQKVLSENSEKIGNQNVDLNLKFKESVTGMSTQNVDGGVLFLFDKGYTAKEGKMKDFFDNNVIISEFNGKEASFFVGNWHSGKKHLDDKGKTFLNVDYVSSLSANVSFEMLGLFSFDKINSIYCECIKSASVSLTKKCFEDKFPRFDVVTQNQYGQLSISSSAFSVPVVTADNTNMNLVSVASAPAQPSKIKLVFTSKDEYYIEKKMQYISFSLVFDYFEDGKSPSNLKFCPSVSQNSASIIMTS